MCVWVCVCVCVFVSIEQPVSRWIMHWPCGLMDKALVFGTKDCRFESCQGQCCFHHVLMPTQSGFEPPWAELGCAPRAVRVCYTTPRAANGISRRDAGGPLSWRDDGDAWRCPWDSDPLRVASAMGA